MKKILSICAMALLLGAGVIGCSGSTTSAPPVTPKITPAGAGAMGGPPAGGAMGVGGVPTPMPKPGM
jgi:hypothetical protein